MPDSGYVLNLRTEAAQKEANDAIMAGVREGGEQFKAAAQALSPKLTGKNAASIQVHVRRLQDGVKMTAFTESGYGGIIEIGTRNRKEQPYMYPAAVQTFPNIADHVRVNLAKAK